MSVIYVWFQPNEFSTIEHATTVHLLVWLFKAFESIQCFYPRKKKQSINLNNSMFKHWPPQHQQQVYSLCNGNNKNHALGSLGRMHAFNGFSCLLACFIVIHILMRVCSIGILMMCAVKFVHMHVYGEHTHIQNWNRIYSNENWLPKWFTHIEMRPSSKSVFNFNSFQFFNYIHCTVYTQYLTPVHFHIDFRQISIYFHVKAKIHFH